MISSSAEVVQWNIEDVSRWLEELGLGEHCGAFQEQSVIGTKLIGLRKSDLQVRYRKYIFDVLLCAINNSIQV